MLAVFLISPNIQTWEGYDYNKGSYVEIIEGNLVRSGNEVEFYDYGSGENRSGEVESVTGFGASVVVVIYDNNAGEYRALDMD
jgi:hypothetical protein